MHKSECFMYLQLWSPGRLVHFHLHLYQEHISKSHQCLSTNLWSNQRQAEIYPFETVYQFPWKDGFHRSMFPLKRSKMFKKMVLLSNWSNWHLFHQPCYHHYDRWLLHTVHNILPMLLLEFAGPATMLRWPYPGPLAFLFTINYDMIFMGFDVTLMGCWYYISY